MGKFVTKSDIFASGKEAFKPQTVYVAGWGGDVKFKPMSMSERREIRKKASVPGLDELGNPTQIVDQESLELWAIINCTLDPSDEANNRLMFGPQDFDALEKSVVAGSLSVLSLAILKASGMGPDSSFRKKEEGTEKG